MSGYGWFIRNVEGRYLRFNADTQKHDWVADKRQAEKFDHQQQAFWLAHWLFRVGEGELIPVDVIDATIPEPQQPDADPAPVRLLGEIVDEAIKRGEPRREKARRNRAAARAERAGVPLIEKSASLKPAARKEKATASKPKRVVKRARPKAARIKPKSRKSGRTR